MMLAVVSKLNFVLHGNRRCEMKQTEDIRILNTFCEMLFCGFWKDSCMGCSQQRDAGQNEAA